MGSNQIHQKVKRLFDVGVSFLCAPPLPIPNREVKLLNLDDTSGFGPWESRVCQDINAKNSVRDCVL